MDVQRSQGADTFDRRPPKAFLITFSCYGTRLHGDESGSVDRDHNAYHAPFLDLGHKDLETTMNLHSRAELRGHGPNRFRRQILKWDPILTSHYTQKSLVEHRFY